MTRVRTALGFRHHTGWANLVAITSGKSPSVLRRERVELLPARLPGAVYHDIGERGLSLAKAEARVAQVEAAVAKVALAAVKDAVAASGAEVVGLVGEPRLLPALPSILRSHPLWHAAEGEMYREALAEAAHELGLPVVNVPPKQVHAEACRALGLDEAAVDELLKTLGQAVGSPWQRDHKDAALAGLIALRS